MATFESIFANSTSDANPKLDALFKKKAKPSNPNTQTILNAITTNKNEDKNEPTQQQQSSEQTPSTSTQPATTTTTTKSRRKKKQPLDAQKESRTIFIGNLPSDIKKEDLQKAFKSYGKIEAIRFRNIVPEDPSKTKKFAFITHQQHPKKTTINAFLRFDNEQSATNALETNGMELKSHHIRVDLSTNNNKYDNKRSVFLGGLPFTIDEESVRSHFNECGTIENVRIIRDNKTGIGKGIGYIQFKTSDSINLAIKLNGSELENRVIRVERCSKKQKESKKRKIDEMNKKKRENKIRNNKKMSKILMKGSRGGGSNRNNEEESEEPAKKRFKNDRNDKNNANNKNKKNKKQHKHKKPTIRTNRKQNTKLKL